MSENIGPVKDYLQNHVLAISQNSITARDNKHLQIVKTFEKDYPSSFFLIVLSYLLLLMLLS